MIWRCTCGYTVSRHDEPRQGTRVFWCKPCRRSTTFTMHARDQRRPKRLRTTWQPPVNLSAKRGDFIEYNDEEDAA